MWVLFRESLKFRNAFLRQKEADMAKINPIELQKSLKGVDYPAKKDDIVKAAENNGAEDEILEALRNISEDNFEKPTDVTKALSDEM
jgi:hypothetical protein